MNTINVEFNNTKNVIVIIGKDNISEANSKVISFSSVEEFLKFCKIYNVCNMLPNKSFNLFITRMKIREKEIDNVYSLLKQLKL